MTTHEEWFAALRDNPSRWVMEAACAMVGEENVHAATVRRLETPSEGADVEVMFAAATTGGILTSTTTWTNTAPHASWLLTPWRLVERVEVEAEGSYNDDAAPTSATVYMDGGEQSLELPLGGGRRVLSEHELEVLRAIMVRVG